MSYRTDWSDEHGHLFGLFVWIGPQTRCWFCSCRPDSRAAKKRCPENPETPG